jgi:hypothetical protein
MGATLQPLELLLNPIVHLSQFPCLATHLVLLAAATD